MKRNSSISIRLLATAISEALIYELSLEEIRRLYSLISLINQNILTAIALYKEVPLAPLATEKTLNKRSNNDNKGN